MSRTTGVESADGRILEMVYCRATTCRHNQKHHCQIVNPLDGDDKISLDKSGRCENFFTA